MEEVIIRKKERIKQVEKEIDVMYDKYRETGDRGYIFKLQDKIAYLEHLYIELKTVEEALKGE